MELGEQDLFADGTPAIKGARVEGRIEPDDDALAKTRRVLTKVHRAEHGATWRIEAEQKIEAENAEAEKEIQAKRVKLLGLQTARGIKLNFGINVDFSLLATIVKAGFEQAKSTTPIKLEREVKTSLCHARDDRERMEQLNLFLKSVLKHDLHTVLRLLGIPEPDEPSPFAPESGGRGRRSGGN